MKRPVLLFNYCNKLSPSTHPALLRYHGLWSFSAPAFCLCVAIVVAVVLFLVQRLPLCLQVMFTLCLSPSIPICGLGSRLRPHVRFLPYPLIYSSPRFTQG